MIGRLAAVLALGGLVAAAGPLWATSPSTTRSVLSVDGEQLLIAGKPAFLLGCSYYGALSASDAWIRADLRQLRHWGFNWVRVWATWSAYGSDVSVVDEEGNAREPWMGRLKTLILYADELGMVVDVTISRSFDHQTHLQIARTLAWELRPLRNVYFDLGNERNIGDARHVGFDEVGELVEAVRQIDRERIVTASQGGDISDAEIERYVAAGVDMLTPHRPRHPGTAAETAAETARCRETLRRLGRVMPVHYQEPFRRDYDPRGFQPAAEDFLADALAARQSGAAGWCLHNGGNRAAPDERPRRSFDMGPEHGRLFRQLDAVELDVIHRAAAHLGLPR